MKKYNVFFSWTKVSTKLAYNQKLLDIGLGGVRSPMWACTVGRIFGMMVLSNTIRFKVRYNVAFLKTTFVHTR